MTRTAAYGSWQSPISAELIAGQTVSFGGLQFDGGRLYWSESRPREGGRQTLMRAAGEGPEELLAAPFNARTRAHEYGGGAFAVANGTVWFCHHVDQRLYRLEPGETPVALTAEAPRRYADLCYDARHARLIAVCEEHVGEDEPVNSLVAIDVASGRMRTLAAGADFYSSPAPSPDGRALAWLSWRHPNMPWDGTELWLAALDGEGGVREVRRVAGGAAESVFQPQFAPDGTLCFVSDRSGWWNLYRERAGQTEALHPRSAEFGLPQWVFGMSTYAFVSAREMVCAFSEGGRWQLAFLDIGRGALEPIETPYTEIGTVRSGGGRVAFIGAAPERAPQIALLDPGTRRLTVVRRSLDTSIDPGCLSRPQPVRFPTTNGEYAHGFFYPPANGEYRADAGSRPPLLVFSHGGPTAAASSGLNLRIQYWTSRGVAVLDVNYRGSTGHGRAYREQLNGRWGIAEVEDCVHGARYLVEQGLVDGRRLAIRGGSAGGYTTLCALVFHDTFRAGASHYGVSDLERLARDTHKFEKHYLERLIGPYPERRDLYRARSPIHHAARLATPVIFFQGLDDKVVPPDQTESMVRALRARGVAVAYVPFAGEAHGLRRAESIRRALEAELYFYGKIFGFVPADEIEPVEIENL
jgi:dipeptidyl aminopeptidase/acylaminoacyl peptidase